MGSQSSCCDDLCFALKTNKICSSELCPQGGVKVSIYIDTACDGVVGAGDKFLDSFVICNGVKGPPGVTGATGACCTGSTGSTGSTEYAYIYNLAALTPVAIDADVLFDTNGLMTSGITHTPGASQIQIVTPGTYEITFIVTALEPNQFALVVNNSLPVVPGSIYGSGAGTQQNVGQVITTFAANDVLTLRNRSSPAAVTLQTLSGGTQSNTVASILLVKLN